MYGMAGHPYLPGQPSLNDAFKPHKDRNVAKVTPIVKLKKAKQREHVGARSTDD